MKRLTVLAVFIASVAASISAQDRVYFTTYTKDAACDVLFVNTPTLADVCVNMVYKRENLHLYKNSWYVTDRRSDATLILRIVTTSNGNRNAIRVYRHYDPVRSLTESKVHEYQMMFMNCFRE